MKTKILLNLNSPVLVAVYFILFWGFFCFFFFCYQLHDLLVECFLELFQRNSVKILKSFVRYLWNNTVKTLVFQSGLIVFGTIFLGISYFFVHCRKSSNCLQLRLTLKLFWRSSVDGQQMEFPEMIMTKGKLFCCLSRVQQGQVVRVLYL